MATVGDVSDLFEVSPQTVRSWCEAFAEHLSGGANPPSGEARNFTEDDLAVLALVAQRRKQLIGYEGIRQALASGHRGEVPRTKEQNEQSSVALAIPYERKIAHLEGRLLQMENDRQRLHLELIQERKRSGKQLVDQDKLQRVEEERDTLRNRIEEVTERAIRAEATLEAYQSMRPLQPVQEAPSAPDSPIVEVQAVPTPLQEPRKSWWDRLRGR